VFKKIKVFTIIAMTLYTLKDRKPNVDVTAFVAPTATLVGKVTVGAQSSLWFQSVLRGDYEKISIGDRTSIQDLTMCHTDINKPLYVGNGVTVGHRSVLHGCTIEDDCLIGMGAIVMNSAVIGRGTIIAAGAVVLEKMVIPPYSLVTGVPGEVKKTFLEGESLAAIQGAAARYVKLSNLFRSSLI
jgi:carbonic anhydrase/acetyltransferase-like protein (isoleucine patch superfamily)